jgi:hypothetical protein
MQVEQQVPVLLAPQQELVLLAQVLVLQQLVQVLQLALPALLHHLRLWRGLLQLQQFDLRRQLFFAVFLQQEMEFLYQLCLLKLQEVARQQRCDRLRTLTNV